MIQELSDLRASIVEGRIDDALEIIDDLDGMSRKSILRHIKTYLVRMLIHLIKNEVEQRLSNYCFYWLFGSGNSGLEFDG